MFTSSLIKPALARGGPSTLDETALPNLSGPSPNISCLARTSAVWTGGTTVLTRIKRIGRDARTNPRPEPHHVLNLVAPPLASTAPFARIQKPQKPHLTLVHRAIQHSLQIYLDGVVEQLRAIATHHLDAGPTNGTLRVLWCPLNLVLYMDTIAPGSFVNDIATRYQSGVDSSQLSTLCFFMTSTLFYFSEVYTASSSIAAHPPASVVVVVVARPRAYAVPTQDYRFVTRRADTVAEVHARSAYGDERKVSITQSTSHGINVRDVCAWIRIELRRHAAIWLHIYTTI